MWSRRSRSISLLAAIAATTALAGGCGDATSSTATGDDPSTTYAGSYDTPSDAPSGSSVTASPSTTPSGKPTHAAPPKPSCLTIWVPGKKLPGGYEGCQIGGKVPPVGERPCEFGKPLVTFGTHFYAVPGGTIHRTAGDVRQDKGYKRALLSCGG